MKLDINPQFEKALRTIREGKNVFITGKAGTGKSTLLDYFRNNTDLNIAVLAPTGVAAVNIKGQTIHSFFGFGPDITIEKVRKDYKNKNKKGFYKKLDAILIDEISMVRADLLDCVDEFLRLNGKAKNSPFGATQMIFIGDLYQLPPVVTSKERDLFISYYDSPYFFSAKVMEKIDLEIVELEKIYRQSDQKFIEILNAIRNKTLETDHLSRLNIRLDENFEPNMDDLYMYLTTTNKKAFEVNNYFLNRLDTKTYSYEGFKTGKFEDNAMPTDHVLDIKKGAQIMLVNNDRSSRWVNGTVGKIIDIEPDEEDGDLIIVELDSGDVVEVAPYTWEMFNFVFDKENSKITTETVGSFTQYPIILAWAITIHKSQGKTFEKVIIDMDRGAFAHGQTYVALSRCTSLEGIVLRKPIKESHVMVDWRVMKFLTGYHYTRSDESMPVDEKVKLIQNAILNSFTLKFTYLKSNDVRSERELIPYRVDEMEYMGKSFLGVEGFDSLRQEDRVFRVDRILEISTIK